MTILGLSVGAQIIVLQALATYAAITSAFFLARPVMRGQTVQAHRDLLANLVPTDSDVNALIAQATDVLTQSIKQDQPRTFRDNRRGVILLFLSFVLFTGAVALQISTDPAFLQEGEQQIRR